MASPQRQVDFARALQNPQAVFDTPEAVLQHRDLSRQQKIEILRRWEFDARELEVAEEENMGGGESSGPLRDIRKALISLGGDQDQEQASPTKHGGT